MQQENPVQQTAHPDLDCWLQPGDVAVWHHRRGHRRPHCHTPGYWLRSPGWAASTVWTVLLCRSWICLLSLWNNYLGILKQVYPLFSLPFHCRQITVGPTAVNYLMSYNYAGGSPYKAVTLSFWAGLIEMLAGFFNLGFMIQFISKPVLSAFTNVVAIKVGNELSRIKEQTNLLMAFRLSQHVSKDSLD